jgi:hypothetical protein
VRGARFGAGNTGRLQQRLEQRAGVAALPQDAFGLLGDLADLVGVAQRQERSNGAIGLFAGNADAEHPFRGALADTDQKAGDDEVCDLTIGDMVEGRPSQCALDVGFGDFYCFALHRKVPN